MSEEWKSRQILIFGGVDAQEIPGGKPEVWLALPSELCRMTLSRVEFLTLAPGTSWCSRWFQAEEPEIKCQHLLDHQKSKSVPKKKKQERSRKTSISALLTMPKPLTMRTTINCGKFWKRSEYQPTWPSSWETYLQVRKQQLEQDMEQQTGCK